MRESSNVITSCSLANNRHRSKAQSRYPTTTQQWVTAAAAAATCTPLIDSTFHPHTVTQATAD